MPKVFRTDEYEKSGKTVDWLDEFLTSYAKNQSIQDMLDLMVLTVEDFMMVVMQVKLLLNRVKNEIIHLKHTAM